MHRNGDSQRTNWWFPVGRGEEGRAALRWGLRGTRLRGTNYYIQNKATRMSCTNVGAVIFYNKHYGVVQSH